MKIFGIINVTPDSFSGTGEWEGADVLDIGAESTRPNATPVTAEEEIARLELVFNEFVIAAPEPQSIKKSSPSKEVVSRWMAGQARHDAHLSLDTRHPETAAKFASRITYLNDVSGFQSPEMVKIAVENNLAAIAMHSLTVPANPDVIMQGDVVAQIMEWATTTHARLEQAGIKQIILDPGLGFGKNREQNWQIVDNIKTITNHIHSLGAEILVGHSRKSFLSDKPAKERDADTANLSISLQKAGVDYIRVHNVPLNKKIIGEGISLLHQQN